MGIQALWLIVGSGLIALFMAGIVSVLVVLRIKRRRGKEVILEYEGIFNISI